jgi:hypothetical protein
VYVHPVRQRNRTSDDQVPSRLPPKAILTPAG